MNDSPPTRFASCTSAVQSNSTPPISQQGAHVQALVEATGLRSERVETFRFHLDKPLEEAHVSLVRRSLDALDRALPRHRLGDIVAVLARRGEG